ncbi:MAG: HNH endonuclease [Candidatus Thorarchaeota archaeon]
MSGGSSSSAPYYKPVSPKKRPQSVQPKRVEVDASGKKKYVYDCSGCGKEHTKDRKRNYQKAYCDEDCRRAAFGALGSSRKGTKRTPKEIESMSKGQTSAWADPSKRAKRLEKSIGAKRRGPDKKPKESKPASYGYTCTGCGKPFRTKRKKTGEKKFHDADCRNQWQSKQKKGTYPTCANPYCDNKFYKKASRDKKYCSMECAKSDPNYWEKVSATHKARYGRPGDLPGWFDKRTNPEAWEPIAKRNRELDNHICQSCGRKWESPENQFAAHHILPKRLGGPDEDWNLMALCPSCHRKTDAQGGPVRFPNPFRGSLV